MIRTKIFHVTAKGTMGLYEGKMVRQGGVGGVATRIYHLLKQIMTPPLKVCIG